MVAQVSDVGPLWLSWKEIKKIKQYLFKQHSKLILQPNNFFIRKSWKVV